jgi:hypothetical protein
MIYLRIVGHEKEKEGENMNDNFTITINNIPAHKQQLDAALTRAFRIIGIQGSANVAQITPVDSGNLKGSIDYKSYNDHVVIGTNVQYAIYQEMGTIKMRAANRGKGYLRFAIQKSVGDFQRIFQEELRNL